MVHLQISSHDEIVLDDESGLLRMHDEALDDTCTYDTLLRIEVGGRLVDQVNVRRQAQSHDDSHTLQFTTGQILYFLVNEVIELERLDNVGLELGRQECLLDPLEKELADSAFEFRSDGLRLHTDPHLGDSLGAIWLERTRQESTEGGLSGTVLALFHNLVQAAP